MKKILITIWTLLAITPIFVFAAPSVNWQRTLLPIDSTENLGTTTSPWDELHVNQICLTADCKTAWPTGGGGSGGGSWSTTTSQVSGQLINYPNNTTDIVNIGSTATTTGKWWYNPNNLIGYLSGKFGIGTTSPYAPLSVVGSGGVVAENFNATSTNATSTFNGGVYFKKDPWVDVRAYGAIGDGITDDTTAIQSALNAGKNVYFPTGTYIASNLTLNANQRISGNGTNSKIKFKTGSTGYLLNGSGISFNISYIDIWGGGSSTMAGVTATGTRSGVFMDATVSGNSITNTYIHGFDYMGLNIYGNTNSRINSPVVSNSSFYQNFIGIETNETLADGGEYVRFTGNSVTYNRWGMRIGSGNIVVTGCTIDDNGIGVAILNGNNQGHGVLTSSLINHNGVYSLYVDSIGNGFTITNNQIFFGDIVVLGGAGINISDNTIDVTNITLTGGSGNVFKNNWLYVTPTLSMSGWIYKDNYQKASDTYSQGLSSLIVNTNATYNTTTNLLSILGKLGVGTTSPYTMLGVAGEVVGANFTATTSTASVFPYASTTALTATTLCLSTDCRTSWPSGGGAGGTWSTTTNSVSGQFNNYSNNNTDVVVIGNTSTSTAKFIFDPNTTNAYLEGKVGVGVRSPLNTLTVNGSASFGSGSLVGFTGSTLLTTANYMLYGDSSNSIINVASGGKITFRVANSDKAYINATGLGIGTSSPHQSLTVNGNAYIAGNVTSTSTTLSSTFPYASTTALSGNTICLSTDCRTTWPSAGGGVYPFDPATNYNANNQATTGIPWFQNGLNASSTSHIASTTFAISGNVGIGTTSPSQKLEVAGTIQSDGALPDLAVNWTNTANYGRVIFKENNTEKGAFQMIGSNFVTPSRRGAMEFYNSTAAPIIYFINGAEKMRVDSTGNVGIGTSTPYRSLSVADGAVFGSDVIASYFTATSTATSTFNGPIDMVHPYTLTTHAVRGDASDGVQILANNFTPVGLFGSAGTANALFYGGVNIDGATRLATSLDGCLTATAGAVTSTGSACGSGGGTFSWTPTSWGVSTSTTLGFLNGFLSTASSTITSISNLHIPGGSSGQVLSTDGAGNLSWATAGGSSQVVGGFQVLATSTTMTLDLSTYATSTEFQMGVGTANITLNPINATSSLGAWWYLDVSAPLTGVIGTTTISYCNWNGQVNPGSGVVNGLTDKYKITAMASTTSSGTQVRWLGCDYVGSY